MNGRRTKRLDLTARRRVGHLLPYMTSAGFVAVSNGRHWSTYTRERKGIHDRVHASLLKKNPLIPEFLLDNILLRTLHRIIKRLRSPTMMHEQMLIN